MGGRAPGQAEASMMSQHSANPVGQRWEVSTGEPEPSFLPGVGGLAQLPSSQFILGLLNAEHWPASC